MRRIARSLDVAVIAVSILCGTGVTMRTIGSALVHRESALVHPQPGRTGRYNYEVSDVAPVECQDRQIAVQHPLIVPAMRDGVAIGFRLVSVRPCGPLAALGFRNGDIVEAVNGISMTSPDRALRAFTKLKMARHLSVAIERAGCRLTIEVIRGDAMASR
jgi:type II secretory pathway component PulC